MGLESYFIILLPEGIIPYRDEEGLIKYNGQTNITINDFVQNELLKQFIIKNISKYNLIKYSIEDTLIMRFTHENKVIKTINLEGCFSWYDEGLQLCYRLIKQINNIIPVRVYHPSELEFYIEEEEVFIIKIKDIYKDKYDSFCKNFGNLHFQVLPGNFFIKQRENKNHLIKSNKYFC